MDRMRLIEALNGGPLNEKSANPPSLQEMMVDLSFNETPIKPLWGVQFNAPDIQSRNVMYKGDPLLYDNKLAAQKGRGERNTYDRTNGLADVHPMFRADVDRTIAEMFPGTPQAEQQRMLREQQIMDQGHPFMSPFSGLFGLGR
jgi:hypothetical protein